MKPAAFRYLKPRSEEELVAALGEHGGEARLLAGGQSLVPMMNFRVVAPAILIDINGLSALSFVRFESGAVEIGALTRHAALEDSGKIGDRLRLIPEAMGELGHRAVRNRGTVGGSLALAYPNAEWPLLLITLGAELHLRSRAGDRRVPVGEFITGPLTTVLAEDEFIRTVHVPAAPAGAGTAFVEVSRRHGDFALAAAAAVITLDAAGRMHTVQAGSSGGQGRPVRLHSLEAMLGNEQPTGHRIDEAARAAVDALDVDDDLHLPSGYRRLLLTTVLQRALQTAAERAGERHAA